MKCNQRLDQITLMQVLGCIFVIMGHSYPFGADAERQLFS